MASELKSKMQCSDQEHESRRIPTITTAISGFSSKGFKSDVLAIDSFGPCFPDNLDV